MPVSSDLRVLFRAPAGPRRGFGHLVRSISLARAMGVRPLLCLRGPSEVQDTAVALGVSPATVKRDWSIAQAWLHREIQRDLG